MRISTNKDIILLYVIIIFICIYIYMCIYYMYIYMYILYVHMYIFNPSRKIKIQKKYMFSRIINF